MGNKKQKITISYTALIAGIAAIIGGLLAMKYIADSEEKVEF